MDEDVAPLNEDPRLARGLLYATIVVAILFIGMFVWLGSLLIEQSGELDPTPPATSQTPR